MMGRVTAVFAARQGYRLVHFAKIRRCAFDISPNPCCSLFPNCRIAGHRYVSAQQAVSEVYNCSYLVDRNDHFF